MQKSAIFALLLLSLGLHTLSFWMRAKATTITLYDKHGSNPVVLTHADLAVMLRLARQAGLSEGDTYMLYVVAREPMGVEYVKKTSPVGPYGAYDKHLESLQQRGLIKDDRGVWILTDRGRAATSVPQQ